MILPRATKMQKTLNKLALAALLIVGLVPGAALAACRDMAFEGNAYTVCEATASDDLRLFQSGPDGPLQTFAAVDDQLAPNGQRLGFAMNAGMFHPDLSPVGLYIEDGTTRKPIVTRAGPGNFGLLPNGVFCIADQFSVVESRRFAAEKPACRFASQSGPMLVIDGALHPRFTPDSQSLHIRNGVGVSSDGSRAIFAISDQPVNFYSFARLFRDGLSLSNALYFDGSISRLYAPELNRNDVGFPMGPMIGLVVPKG